MCKGGNQGRLAKGTSSAVWKSPYNPLSKDAPEIPTKGQIKAVIPKECFEKSYLWSLFYTARDFAMSAGLALVMYNSFSTEVPSLDDPVRVLGWLVAWSLYAFWQGTIWTGVWILAHECGHGAFSPSQTFDDIVGFILHQSLLVPYFAWQYSHAKHHRRTNHLVDGESHIPTTREESGLSEKMERLTFYAAWRHEVMGDSAYAAFQVWGRMFFGWPMYLLGLISTGRLSNDGKPLNGAIADHFRPNSPMFPEKLSVKIMASTLGVLLSLAGLGYLMYVHGAVPVICWYWGPYIFVNAWLVLFTWLHHTDASVPHYGEGEWTWVKGALCTIDRPYGIFDFFHHRIGSTHVVHHLFHELPWYNALKATQAIKAYLEPKGLYNYDPTFWPVAMWRIAHTCHYVDDTTGIQYYKSLEDVPRTQDRKKTD